MRGMSGRPLRLSTAVVFGRDVAARMQGALAPRPVERFLVRYHLEAIEDSLIKRSARQPTNRQCRPTGKPGLCFGGAAAASGGNMTERQWRAQEALTAKGASGMRGAAWSPGDTGTALAAALAYSCWVDPKGWWRRSRKVALLSVLCRACAPTATSSPTSCDTVTGEARTFGAARPLSRCLAPHATTDRT